MKPDQQTGLPYLVQDLEMRLNRSLVKYNGRPFFIEEVQPNCVLLGKYLDTQRLAICELPNKNLDIRPVPLGYVNLSSRAMYVSRIPRRKYKQGLNDQNILLKGYMLDGVRVTDLLRSKNLCRCINDEYPSLSDAIKHAEEHESCAFSRKFAVRNEEELGVLSLQYRGSAVGIVMHGELQLNSSNQYLREELEAVLNKEAA